MEPTLHDGDYLIVLKNRSLLGRFWRKWIVSPHSQVVLFSEPHESNSILVKRVIAVGGENVQIVQGRVIVNGSVIHEPYMGLERQDEAALDSWPIDFGRAIEIPAHSYFVLGDNRSSSVDSRSFGSVPENRVIGVVALIAHHAYRDPGN